MIRIRNLHKSFNDHKVFQGIDVDVDRGEVVVLIGPSGSGKSTFLRCINGLESFEQGEIEVGDIVLHSINRAKPSRQGREAVRQVHLRVGMVFQQFNLFPHMTVLENVIEAPIRVLGMAHRQAEEEARMFLARIHLGNKADCYPATLSGGEQQRTAIARALAMKPRIMLFDEPTASLDPETVGEVLSVIRELVSQKEMTAIISTHEMGFAREVADRVIVLAEGTIIESGAPESLFTNPRQERTRIFLTRVLKRE
ncbi:MAG TPA: amino acid ABC transporter ATP-binding protein [Nitrospirota bacterium]|nr:amino acid ABC transporter ATP-binding protein [Nitrospirota bacterium]